jgi:hypothetical protein
MAILTYFPKDLGDLIALQSEQAALAEEWMRCRFEWNGGEYPCTAGALKEGKELGLGGWELRKKVKVRVRTEVLGGGDRPKTNDTIVVYLSENGTGIKMRILSTENNFDTILEIDAVDTNHP